jgi:putative PIN family toxin of toxin-antitoxin system
MNGKSFLSPEMANELKDVRVREGKDSPEILFRFNQYLSLTTLVTPAVKLKMCRDPNDDFVLECAASAEAQIIIASDKDLLQLPSQAALYLEMELRS